MMRDRSRVRGEEFDWRGPAVLFVGLVAAAWLVPATRLSDWIVCPFWSIFDINCPGCGMTRSLGALVRGDLAGSVDYHAFGPLLVVGLAVVAGLRVGDRVAGRRLLAGLRDRWNRHSTAIWGLALAAVLGYWGLRFHIGFW